MPDIENIKEISYIFSVSVDSLIGDVESKSTLKIKKKIDDIGWFVFSFIIECFIVILSLVTFVEQLTDNVDIIFLATTLIIIFAIVIFIIELKTYLRNTKEKIINMKPDKESQKIRKKELLKKWGIIFLRVSIFLTVLDINRVFESSIAFIRDIILNIIISAGLTAIFGFIDYRKLENKVKKLNEK